MTEYAPPNNMAAQGEEVGVATAIVKAMLSRAQIGYRIREFPWRRAYHEALVNSNTCVYSTIPTDERKPLFKWVGPILSDSWVAFSKETNRARIASLDDLYAYRLGTSLGSARSAFLSENKLVSYEALTDELNLKMLESGRIDFWITSRRRGEYFIRSQGIDNIKAMFSLSRVDYFLACNKSTPTVIIDRLNEAAKALSEGWTALR